MEDCIISDKLSDPMLYNGVSIEKILDEAMDNFYHSFLKEEVKPKYNSKDIFFNMNKKYANFTLKYPEKFLHISSLDIDDTKYDMLFCENDWAKNSCFNTCENGSSNNSNFRLIGRIECIYRINRLHWIPEIISIANSGSNNIKEWNHCYKNGKGILKTKRCIRYTDKAIDYIIILEESKNGYDFITAFPVLLKSFRRRFDKEYSAYKN